MAICHHCGAETREENFCGVCGARQESVSAPVTEQSAQPEMYSETYSDRQEQPAREERPTSMSSQRGTGELIEDGESGTSVTSGSARRGKPKTLESGKVLNHRYEVVRRIGGGGM